MSQKNPHFFTFSALQSRKSTTFSSLLLFWPAPFSKTQKFYQWSMRIQFSFRIDNTINLPYLKMFTHRSIANPSNFSPFEHTFSFFWNSTDKVTVFKFTAWVKDAKEKESNVSLATGNKFNSNGWKSMFYHF